MGGSENIYSGGDYGFEPKYKDEFTGYRLDAKSISLATNPFTANQLQEVTGKLNTGARALEINMAFVDPQQGAIAESIPNQHLEELNRLRKITGAEFTVHGALLEPTGVIRNNWNDTDRQQIERQMWVSLSRAKKVVGKDDNVVVTFHSSNGLPEPETFVFDEQTGQPRKTSIWVVDERNGAFSTIHPKENKLTGQKADPFAELEKTNKDNWERQLSQTAFHAHAGSDAFEKTLIGLRDRELPSQLKAESLMDLYKKSKSEEGQKLVSSLSPEAKKAFDDVVHNLNYGEIYVNDAYNELQNLFSQAYDAAERDKRKGDLNVLDNFKREIQKNQKQLLEDPSKKAEVVLRGVDILNTISTPQIVRPLKDFAIDKASETFSNLAVRAYKEFETKGEAAPIISIENPPAGSGLSRAEDIKDIIEKARDKFAEKAVKEFGISEKKAKQEAEKLIGATWDLGHINMIRKFGFDETELVKQTETIAPYVKNIHLSDNFGMEHTELPMGMGNVPTKAHMEMLSKYNNKMSEIKKVVETGNWYTQFKTTPFAETLSAFGSPIYAMQMGPNWNNIYGRSGANYFAGYGMNPDIHHTIYGAGFSGLPLELGGQIAGRSRFSGTAME